MAKGLRSKVKRAFRTAKRTRLAETPALLDAEAKRQDIMSRVLEQGKAAAAARDAERAAAEAAAPQGMDTGDAAAGASGAAAAGSAEKMEMDVGTALGAKLRRGLGKRLKKVKTGLSGANQFHAEQFRKRKSKRKGKNKYNPGYTLTTSF